MQQNNDAALVRHVVQKAGIDLAVEDVLRTYYKITKLALHEAVGEYVEQAQIQNQGSATSAYITLRVRNDRLSTVLNTLRELGKVTREQTEAQDVTAQVVDIEARLRNDRRIEQELLTLLDKRKDAPLADIMKVSESLGQVRERIEKLVAERERVGRQVALATVVVSILPQSKASPSIGVLKQLRTTLASACTDGCSCLISSIAWLVQVVIGGAVLWIILMAVILLARRWYLRQAP